MGVKKVFLGVLVTLLGASAIALPSAKPVSLYVSQAMHNSSKAEADRLLKLGEQQMKDNQPKAALESFQKALPIYQQVKERLAEGHTHRSIGNAYLSLKDYPQAIAHQQQALSIAREIKNPDLEARALLNLGRANAGQGNTAKAIDYYQQSLAIARANQNREVELKALSNLAQNNPRKVEADRLLQQGIEQGRTGRFKAALQSFQEALNIYQAIKDPQGESNALGNLGTVLNIMGDYPKAIEYSERSLKIFQEIKFPSGEGKALTSLGNAYYYKGDYPKAIEYHQQSLKIAREIKSREVEGTALGNLGNAYNSLGDYLKAIEYLQQSLKIFQEIKDRSGEGTALGNLGNAYNSLGDYPKAIEHHQQSLKIFQEIKSRSGEGTALGNLGNDYLSLGDYPKAIEYHKQSLKIFQEIKSRSGEGTALGNLGTVYGSIGNDSKAIEYYQQSLKIAQEIKSRLGEGKTLGNLGTVYGNIGDYPKAIEYHQQSLKIFQEIKDRSGEGNSLGDLGLAYYRMGDYPKAIEYHQQSLKIFQEIKDPQVEGYVLNNLGLAYEKIGNLQLAESTLQAGIKVLESLRSGLKDNNKITIFEEQSRAYRNLQRVLIAQNKTNTALEIAERGRARAFVDLLTSKLSDNLKKQLSAPPKIDQIKQIAKLQNATLVQYSIIYDGLKIKGKGKPKFKESYLYIWVIKPTGEISFKQVDLKSHLQKQNTSLQDLVNNNLKDLGVAIDSLRSANNQPNNQQNFAIGNLVRRNTEDRKKDPPWEVVAVNPQNRTVKIRLTTWKKTETPIERTFAQVTKVSYSHTAYTKLQELHKILIDPIADLLPKDPNARVIFIPQASLFFVPFPALQDANRNYLIQKHTIQTAPSIQVLDLTHQQLNHQQRQKFSPEPTDALIVGNPTMPKVSLKPGEPATRLNSLPNAEEEVKKIAQIFKTNPIIGDRATKSAILPLLSKARIIHFATHGLLDDFTAGSIPGAIALAPEVFNNKGKTEETNGLLTASEIFDLKLNAELVVLSACDTGRGKLSGDGVIGLSRSLISAGVPSVIVSLWSIPDAPTASLMTEFYQNLHQGKAFALRQAMLKTMEQHPHPQNWAAFTLIGESN